MPDENARVNRQPVVLARLPPDLSHTAPGHAAVRATPGDAEHSHAIFPKNASLMRSSAVTVKIT